MNESGDQMHSIVVIINNTIIYFQIHKTLDLKCSHHKKRNDYYVTRGRCQLTLWWSSYCNILTGQINMLYTLNTQKLLYLKKKNYYKNITSGPKMNINVSHSQENRKKIDFKYNLLKPKTEV